MYKTYTVAYLTDNFDIQCFKINVVNSVSQFVRLKISTDTQCIAGKVYQ